MKILLLALVLIMTANVFSQSPPLETGVSQMLAKWRAANYSDVRYKLNITLEKGAPLMKGSIEIRVTLNDQGAKNDLILDWRTTQFANDKDKPFADVLQVNESVIKKLPDSGNFAYAIDKEHIIIANRLLKAGENVIKIEFASPIKTSGAAVTRYIDKEDGGEYLYSLFVPSDASTAFPCFDQPDLKARFTLSVSKPKSWSVVTNTDIDYMLIVDGINCLPLQNRTALDLVKNSKSVQKIDKSPIDSKKNIVEPCGELSDVLQFKETQPISTYVFAFAAGDFAEFADTKAPVKMVARKIEPGSPMLGAAGSKDNSDEVVTIDKVPPRIYVRKSQAAKFKPHADEVFRLNREAVKYLENYFDYKYPFPKYDLVLIPEFPFGGMEHAGATFLKESSIIFPTDPTKNDYISRATLIFHETAHQWFGDTVTMKWFDDLWLKEGFAEFMAYKTMEKVLPEYNAWKTFYERNKQLAYLTDSTRGTTPIYQEIPNLSAAKSAYGNIVYRKAPSFLRQSEFYLGEDKFQTAVRAFLKKHEFANAEWTDLVKEFETASGQDLKDWANVWVKQRGLAKITVLSKDNKRCGKDYFLKQINNLGDDGFWEMRVKTLVLVKDGLHHEKDKIIQNIELTNSEKFIYGYSDCENTYYPPLQFIFPNYQDYGYGIFLLDEKSREYILQNIQNEKDDFLRSMMWGALWDSVREGEMNPQDYVALVVKNLARPEVLQTPRSNNLPHRSETDETTLGAVLARVSTAMNYYLSDAQREEFAPLLEKELLDRMSASETAGLQRVFFRAFLNLASTEQSKQTLKQLLRGTMQTKNINLKTKDKFDIATRLLILGDQDAPALLENLIKTEPGDDAKRYAYAARAGIATTENKQKLFDDFLNNKEISESWIEAAFVPFNSPRHSELTLSYLEKALAELPNLKKNRKIFFVNGWLSAFIGGQKSAQALAVVNKFLADNSNLDKDLRLKILENADGLERAVKIRQKFAK